MCMRILSTGLLAKVRWLWVEGLPRGYRQHILWAIEEERKKAA